MRVGVTDQGRRASSGAYGGRGAPVGLTVEQLGWSALLLLALVGIVTVGATLIDWLLDRLRRTRI